MSEASKLRALAVSTAQEAGKLLLSMEPGEAQAKTSPTDLVTAADRAAEELILGRIRSERPDDSFITEEASPREGSTGVTWVIDPLDGTINYIYGLPQWSVSIAAEGSVRLGVVHDPNRDETFTDVDSLQPSTQTDLSQALIGTGFSYSAEIRRGQAEVLHAVLPKVRDVRRAGSCALDLAWVACGRLDGFYEDDTHHWDISAGIALIESAGGVAKTYGSLTLAAGNQSLLNQLEALVT